MAILRRHNWEVVFPGGGGKVLGDFTRLGPLENGSPITWKMIDGSTYGYLF
jgi:hypothetical protein